MAGELRMLRMRFDVSKLFELGRRRRLALRDVDLGYLLHCELKELFGDDCPGPFSVESGRGRHATVLAYSGRSKAELEEHARTFADPAVHAACDLASIEEKVMPDAWATGRRLGFEVRACPIVRMSSDGPRWRRGAEVDAFLARCWKEEGRPVDRGSVYREWLASELERRMGASLVQFELRAFKRERLLRRDHEPDRTSHRTERPDALLGGVLKVTDGAAFRALLARGIGRHRAFGFGMLLLRPPSPC